MEKNGAITPGTTPDTDRKLPPGEKAASASQQRRQTAQLDDDLTKRAADEAAKKLQLPK